jgi:LemA protein
MGFEVWAMLAFFAAILFVLIGVYNRVVALAQRCDQAFADIDVQLKHRHDLIPKLVESVRGFTSHERGVLDGVIQARSAALKAPTPEANIQAEVALGNQITKLMAMVESYPKLQASPHFRELRMEISDTEHKIAAARRFWNMAVTEHNTQIKMWPGSFIAAMCNMQPRARFDLGIDRMFLDEGPAVKF